MEFEVEPTTIIVTAVFWIVVLFLVWAVPFGFDSIRDKILMSLFSLPCIYGVVTWQMNR